MDPASAVAPHPHLHIHMHTEKNAHNYTCTQGCRVNGFLAAKTRFLLENFDHVSKKNQNVGRDARKTACLT